MPLEAAFFYLLGEIFGLAVVLPQAVEHHRYDVRRQPQGIEIKRAATTTPMNFIFYSREQSGAALHPSSTQVAAGARTQSNSTFQNGLSMPAAAAVRSSSIRWNSTIRLSLTPNTASEWI